jgi:hypothetical protein
MEHDWETSNPETRANAETRAVADLLADVPDAELERRADDLMWERAIAAGQPQTGETLLGALWSAAAVVNLVRWRRDPEAYKAASDADARMVDEVEGGVLRVERLPRS